MSRAMLAVTLMAMVAAANAQYIPWANPFVGNATSAKVAVPKCGSSKSQCYEQTAGQPDVTITEYFVTSSVFPCSGGSSATALTFNLKKPITEGTCKVSCDGFGCSTKELPMCGDSFGFTCPSEKGIVSVQGKTGECSSGFGDYIVTITCPLFEFVTYITY